MTTKKFKFIFLIIVMVLLFMLGIGYLKSKHTENSPVTWNTTTSDNQTADAKEITLNGGVNVTENISEYDKLTDEEKKKKRYEAYSNANSYKYDIYEPAINIDESFNDYISSINAGSVPDTEYLDKLYRVISCVNVLYCVENEAVMFDGTGYDEAHSTDYIILKVQDKLLYAYLEDEEFFISEVAP